MEMRGPKLVLGDHQKGEETHCDVMLLLLTERPYRSSDMMVEGNLLRRSALAAVAALPKSPCVLLRISIKAIASHVENRQATVNPNALAPQTSRIALEKSIKGATLG